MKHGVYTGRSYRHSFNAVCTQTSILRSS